MDVAAVADLLEAWASWSRQGRPGPPVAYCAGSAEGRHVAAAGELFDDPDLRALRPRIGDDFGLRVERAVCAVGNPHRDALALWYVRRLPLEVIARTIRVADAGRVLDAAHAAVALRLR